MTENPGQWPAVLQELFVSRQRTFPLRFHGYDRRQVDEALSQACRRLGDVVDECAPLSDLLGGLEKGLEKARMSLAEYDRLHAGERVCEADDEAVQKVIARARGDAEAIVDDARREARVAVQQAERAVVRKLRELEEAEREGRWRLAMSTSVAGDVVREARRGCVRLLTRLVDRQHEINAWIHEFSALLDILPSFHGNVEIPQSRRPDDAIAAQKVAPAENPVAGGSI